MQSLRNKTPLKSYHEHNKEQQTTYLIEQLQSGLDVALVSDAGLPLISDPAMNSLWKHVIRILV